MMVNICWEDSFSVGHPVMDQQHKRIIDLVNDCIEMRSAEQFNQGKYLYILVQLASYAELHFHNEEQLLEQCGFESVQAHAASHQVYRDKINGFSEQEGSLKSLEALTNYLRFWWVHHIEVEDMAYKPIVTQAEIELLTEIQWDDELYDVGDPLLNQQHKKLVSLLNEMIALAVDGSENACSQMPYVLQRFYKFADEHLHKEEQILERCSYKGLAPHTASHQRYLDEVTNFSLRDTDDIAVRRELLLFLLSWWGEHILIEDMAYKEHLQAISESAS